MKKYFSNKELRKKAIPVLVVSSILILAVIAIIGMIVFRLKWQYIVTAAFAVFVGLVVLFVLRCELTYEIYLQKKNGETIKDS